MYELMFILRPDFSEAELKSKAEAIKKLVEKLGGKLAKEEPWGRRNLAYPIEGFAEGVYYLFYLDFPPQKIGELRRSLNLDRDVLRFMVIRSEND